MLSILSSEEILHDGVYLLQSPLEQFNQMDFEVVGGSIYFNGLLYRIQINQSLFGDTYYVMPLLHGQFLPSYSRYFASSIRKGYSFNFSEVYTLGYIEVISLGYPYSENPCQEIFTEQDCLKECINA